MQPKESQLNRKMTPPRHGTLPPTLGARLGSSVCDNPISPPSYANHMGECQPLVYLAPLPREVESLPLPFVVLPHRKHPYDYDVVVVFRVPFSLSTSHSTDTPTRTMTPSDTLNSYVSSHPYDYGVAISLTSPSYMCTPHLEYALVYTLAPLDNASSY